MVAMGIVTTMRIRRMMILEDDGDCEHVLLCVLSARQGNTGRPGPSGPTGPPGQGFQGPKVGAKTCSYIFSSFQSQRDLSSDDASLVSDPGWFGNHSIGLILRHTFQ